MSLQVYSRPVMPGTGTALQSPSMNSPLLGSRIVRSAPAGNSPLLGSRVIAHTIVHAPKSLQPVGGDSSAPVVGLDVAKQAPQNNSIDGCEPQGDSDETEAMIAKLTELIKDRSNLKEKVSELFQETARDDCSMLDFNETLKFLQKFSEAMEIPIESLHITYDDFERYDFDGDGGLEEHECYRLVKSHLKFFRKKLGHSHGDHQIIFMDSVRQAGLTLGKELGHGSFGKVMLATHDDGSQKCVKEVKKSDMKGAGLEELIEEFELMHHMHNENIAKTYDLFHNHTHYYLINEPYHGGDLSKIRQKAREHNVKLTEDYWRNMFKQCFHGLKYLHGHALMHCDIKEENIMLKTDNYHSPEIVIIDFGLAQHHAEQKKQICGTCGYIPPETWESKKWFPRGDVFSMGVTMMQLVIDQVPEVRAPPCFYGVDGCTTGKPQLLPGIFQVTSGDHDAVKKKTCTKEPPLRIIPPNMSGFKIFVAKCLQKDRYARPRTAQAMRDPWLTSSPSEKYMPSVDKAAFETKVVSPASMIPMEIPTLQVAKTLTSSSKDPVPSVSKSTETTQQVQRAPTHTSISFLPSTNSTLQQVQRTAAPSFSAMTSLQKHLEPIKVQLPKALESEKSQPSAQTSNGPASQTPQQVHRFVSSPVPSASFVSSPAQVSRRVSAPYPSPPTTKASDEPSSTPSQVYRRVSPPPLTTKSSDAPSSTPSQVYRRVSPSPPTTKPSDAPSSTPAQVDRRVSPPPPTTMQRLDLTKPSDAPSSTPAQVYRRVSPSPPTTKPSDAPSSTPAQVYRRVSADAPSPAQGYRRLASSPPPPANRLSDAPSGSRSPAPSGSRSPTTVYRLASASAPPANRPSHQILQRPGALSPAMTLYRR